MLTFWDQSASYLDQTPGGTPVNYWIFAQSFDAINDAVERSGGKRFAGLIETFYLAQAARPSGFAPTTYYDDKNWMALALLRAFDLTGQTKYRDQADTLFQDIMGAWDTTCCGAAPGGIWWNEAHTQKATASNAGPVILAARLANRLNKPAYLTFAKQVYDYWTTNMVDPTTYAITDHVNSDGTLVHYRFTYNEGLVIGAALELFRATNDVKYINLAHQVAGYMIANEIVQAPAGSVLFDGTNATCTGDCPEFKGIGFRYLAALYDTDRTHAAYGAVLGASADSIWSVARSSDLFGVDWSQPKAATTRLQEQASASMALARWAVLLGPRPPDATANLEAEEATLHGVGLEATYTGFEGWGYVAGWGANGQSLDFTFDAPAAGNYKLDFRFAAGGTNASRYLVVNGQSAVDNLAFASTGSWSTYADVTTTVTLPSGPSTISLIFNSTKGSAGYLNLDRLAVTAAP
jgi:predicted alpha-1,6-mannanase (GH76 family)